MLKTELRKIYLARQKNLSATERTEKSERIADLFFKDVDLSQVDFLHCFLPIERMNEIDTTLIFHRVWREFPHVKTLVPRVNFQKNEIENLEFTSATEIIKNQWLIHEPAHDELIETKNIDFVLTPLLCFDRRGFRVGYGKGFYDRLLAECREDCLTAGLSYFPPVPEISDVFEFDVKLDLYITPEEIHVTV